MVWLVSWALRQQEIDSLSAQLASQTMNYDGVLLWEITGVREKVEQAKQTGEHVNSPGRPYTYQEKT